MSERVLLPTDDGPMPALLWLPESGRGPGLVVLQEIFGLSPYIERRCADLAAAGYVVLAPQIYWRLGVEAVADGPQMLDEGVGLVQRLDWPAAVGDAAATVEALRDRDETGDRVGVVGFCFGGGLAYNVVSEGHGDALVSFYGSALPGLVDILQVPEVPSQHHFGTADQYIDTDAVERIRAVVTRSRDCEFHLYAGADHAFDNDDFVLHHPEASALAWQRTLDFLHRVLPI